MPVIIYQSLTDEQQDKNLITVKDHSFPFSLDNNNNNNNNNNRNTETRIYGAVIRALPILETAPNATPPTLRKDQPIGT